MSVPVQKPLVVSGIHRSGSTWVGQQLAALDNFGYIQEPFNQDRRSPPVLGVRLPEWYYCVHDGNSKRFELFFDRLFSFRLSWWRMPLFWTTRFHIQRSFELWRDFSRFRKSGRVPLIKDPIALLSLPWLAERYRCRVLIMVRHPAAFVASALRWGFCKGDLGFLKRQSVLENIFGEEVGSLFRELPDQEVSPMDEAIYNWKFIYGVVRYYQKTFSEWMIVPYEKLALDPGVQFPLVAEALGIQNLPVSKSSWGQIKKKDSGSAWNDTQLSGETALDRWKKELSLEQVAQIKEKTSPVWENFYTVEQW